MDEQRQDDRLEPIYNSSVPIQDIALKISRERWTIEMGGERGSGRSVLAVRYYYFFINVYPALLFLEILTSKLISGTHLKIIFNPIVLSSGFFVLIVSFH